jgi:hypothetical protein
MGAELDITESLSRRTPIFAIDVRETKEGERFELTGRQINKEDIKILDVEPENKHLLLMWYERETGTKHKYLCGHDERHWFVAAVPENKSAVKSVGDAMEALKPEAVRDREQKVGLKGEAKRNRWNPAWKRQGEWFFVPVWNKISIKSAPILKNEPIQRGRAKPHMCEFMVRDGGVRVHVCRQFPNGLEEKAYKKLLSRDPRAKGYIWTVRVADAKVFVKGRVSHPDHATINLGSEWHEVLMNRENEAPSMKHLRFLD